MKIDFQPDVCIYHAPCSDGFGAAYAVWSKFQDKVRYIPAYHDDSKLDMDYWLPLVHDKRVVICDFSFYLPQLLQLKAAATELVVLDHHASAQKELGHLHFCHFNLEKSGAILAWEAFHAGPAPELLQYVQDKDLWKFELKSSKEAALYIESFPRNFATWSSLETDLEEDFWSGIDEGEAILRYQNNLVAEIISQAEQWDVAGTEVLAVNSSWLRSEVCHQLLQRSKVAGCYWLEGGRLHWTFRSLEENVAELGQRIAVIGGGHPQAAGATLPFSQVDFAQRSIRAK